MQRTWMIAAAALAATGALAVPAVASAAPSGPSGRLQQICARVPNLTTRVDDAIARLQGDATTPGSLAWLQTKIDEAKAHDRTQLATVLENRSNVRKAKLDLLKVRQTALSAIAGICAEHAA